MSPALLLALALQAEPDPPQLADLRRAYEQSCVSRAYGTFDDVCTQMGDQIRAYERDNRKAARAARTAPVQAPVQTKAPAPVAPSLVSATPPPVAEPAPSR